MFFWWELQLCKPVSTPTLPPFPIKIHFGCEGLSHSSWDRSKDGRCRGLSRSLKIRVSYTALHFWYLDSVVGRSKGPDFICSESIWAYYLRVTRTCPQGNISRVVYLFLFKRFVILERSGYWGEGIWKESKNEGWLIEYYGFRWGNNEGSYEVVSVAPIKHFAPCRFRKTTCANYSSRENTVNVKWRSWNIRN